MKRALVGAAVTMELLALTSGAAWAQSAPVAGDVAATDRTTNPQDADSQSSQGDDSTHSAELDEIVVTAERRSETVQKSSVSIEVFSGEQLKQVSQPTDLTTLTPGVQVGTAGPQPQVYVRGVGDVSGNSRGQSAVAFNIDGIYYARGTQVGPQMYDISRIEVLKGPQGTLYGRNASGGAINIITASPTLDDIHGRVNVDVGNFNNLRLDGSLNVPLSSTVALRVAGLRSRRDGYTSDGGQDEHIDAGRVKLLWEPSANASLLISGDLSHAGGIGSGVVVYPSPDGNPWRGNTEAPYAYPFLFGPGTAPLTAPNDRMLDSTNRGISAEANVDLGFAKLTLIPAYREQDQTAVYYSINFRYAEQLENKQTSFEARLGNESSWLKWVAGFYTFTEKQDWLYTATMGALTGGYTNATRNSIAAFGQATASITDGLRVILGGRYTEEKSRTESGSGTGAVPTIPFVKTTGIESSGEVNGNKFNYKLGAEYDVGPHSMLYATYATGFKAGGANSSRGCPVDPYEPEELSAFTAGSRNRFLGNTLQVNAELFYWKYKNQQIAVVTVDKCGLNTGQFIRNSGAATMKGGNIDVVWRPTASDTIGFGVEYNDAVYDDFVFTQRGIGQFAAGSGTLCTSSPTPGQPSLFDIDCTGQEVPRTPKWAGTASYEHVFALPGGNLRFGANGQFASKRWLDYSFLPNGRAPSYAVFNARINYAPDNGFWELGVYMNNITNEAVYTSGTQVGTLAPNGYRYYTANILAPRMYGVRLGLKF